MPRKRNANSRPGPNRTDLLRPSPEPITTAPGQTYGEAAQQQRALRAAPMGAPPVAPGPTASSVPASAPSSGPLSMLGTPLVGANGKLTRPTERPNEPVTHGLPMGPGAGPEVLQGIGAAARQGSIQTGTVTNLLTSLAAQPNATSAIKDLAARAQSGVQ